jgi:hypothetical protein
MSDLFEKISRGTILLWNVQSEAELPKRKEMIRLVGTDNFTYYKSDGHHRDYIRLLARLKDSLSPIPQEEDWHSYWPRTAMSHFLFTSQKVEINSFFLLKFDQKCLGGYYVTKQDLNELSEHLRTYERVKSLTREAISWPTKIQKHREEIKDCAIADSVIENFDISSLQLLTKNYGEEAMKNALANLDAWHNQYFW